MFRLLPQFLLVWVCAGNIYAATASLQEIIDDAHAGQTVRVTSGVYDGPIIIRQSLTLIGEPGAIIDAQEKGDALRIEAEGVTVRGFHIRGTGDSLDRENSGIVVVAPRAVIEDNVFEDVLFGIYLKQAPDSVIRGNTIGGKELDVPRRGDGIRLWYSRGCLIEDNRVKDSRDVVIWFSNDVTIRDNIVSRGRYGLHFMYCDNNVLERNRLQYNSVGAFLMYSRNLVLHNNQFHHNRGPSGYGIGLKDMDGVDAVGNIFNGNRIGIYFDNSPSSVDVTQSFVRNVLAYNDIALAFQPSTKRNAFMGNSFIENIEQVAVLGTGQFKGNSFTVDGRGNYWSDYTGYDRDGNGVGDVAYKAESLFENLMDREPMLRLFLFSPAQQAIEMASQAVPTIRPTPKITDSAPLMRPVLAAAPLATAAMDRSLFAASLGLILSSCLLLSFGLHRRAETPETSTVQTKLPASSLSKKPILRVETLTKRYGRVNAVDVMSFELRPGEALALWGTNGAGKTTALRCILGLCRYQGQISVDGHDVRRAGKLAKACIGYVPQELAFYDDWAAAELLGYFARLKRVARSRVYEVLDEVGLIAQARKKVGAMSGGMKQRMALAAALLADPPVLLLDEVTANLDTAARHDFLALLVKLRNHGKAILFTSHRLEEVEELADRVMVIDQGKVTATCRSSKLAHTLGLRVGLRMWVDAAQLELAVQLLRDRGYTADRNGRSLCVSVCPDDKGRPLSLLIAEGMPVHNFELDNQHGAASLENKNDDDKGGLPA